MRRKVKRDWQFKLATMAVTFVGMGAFACGSRADIIVGYGPENYADGGPALDVMSGVTARSLTRGDGLNAGSGGTYNSSGWTDEPTDYLQWGWSASSPIDLTDLDLRYDRSSSGPSIVDIQLSVNGGSFQTVYADTDVSTTGEDVLDVDLSSFTAVTEATFRLFGTAASSAGGTFDIEGLSGVDPARGILVSGTAAAVPEPSSLALTTLALLGFGYIRRFRSISADRSSGQ